MLVALIFEVIPAQVKKEKKSASDPCELSLLVENGQIQIAKIAVSNSVDKSDDIDLHATHFIFVLHIQSKDCSKYLSTIRDANSLAFSFLGDSGNRGMAICQLTI